MIMSEKHFISIFSVLLCSCSVVYAQTAPSEYLEWVKKADSLYHLGNYAGSGKTYSLAFKTFGGKGYVSDRYQAAQAWALSGIPDSSFFHLERIAQRGNFSNYDQIAHDASFVSLHTLARWKPILEQIRSNLAKIENGLNLARQLHDLVTEDQKWRNLFVKYNNHQMGSDTTSLKVIRYNLSRTDSLNFFPLQNIFIKHGYPNTDLIGTQGEDDFWLLVQHQDEHPDFQGEVLVKMKTEADRGKASMINYAYLLDRVNVNTNKPQVYGTQMTLNATKTSFEPRLTQEPEKLDERRKNVGLDPIASYIELMNSRHFGNLKMD